MRKLLLLMFLSGTIARAELPPRPASSLSGKAFAEAIKDLSLADREARIIQEFRAGNVPSWLRKPVAITAKNDDDTVVFYAWPDYLAIGSDTDAFRVPLSPLTAQTLADSVDCMLPTPKMTDLIYQQSAIKLTPEPIPPTPAMTTVPVFHAHNEQVETQLRTKNASLGALVAGHKKDVVICAKLKANPGKEAIYGWHTLDGSPIQPLYLGHYDTWVDYSHGIRFIEKHALLNGKRTPITTILADPRLATLLSSEGVVSQPRYLSAPVITPGPNETVETIRLSRGVRIVINRPSDLGTKPALVVFYALPNGNTIEQTIGKKTTPDDDWHYDIQHIAAQTRFIRTHETSRPIVVAYLENELRAWPSWRRTHGDTDIPGILKTVLDRMPSGSTVALNGHSGGGSLIFGYLNTYGQIPAYIERIAFLDSNYAYETEKHRDKLVTWLKASNRNQLVVLAYNDAIATLDGKPFVTAKGGTWGRTEQMIADFTPILQFKSDENRPLEKLTALEGRLTILRHHNPEKKILHTVQVEKNGFIESMLIGTPSAGRDYTYFGDRAYQAFILDK